MKERRFQKYIFLLAAAACLSFYACIDEKNVGMDIPGTNDTYATIMVLLPGNNQAKTYAMTATDENNISGLDLLVFKKDGANETFLYRSSAASITNDNPSGSRKKIRVKVANTEGSDEVRFIMIANAKDILDNANLTVGRKKEDILSELEFASANRWKTNYPSDFTPFPMWGEAAGLITISTTTNVFPTILLLRAVARIDVGLKFTDPDLDPEGLGADFKLEAIEVYNSKNKGLIAPVAANLSNGKAIAPSMPAGFSANGILAYGSTDIDTDKKMLIRSIYLAESPAGIPTDRANAPFLLISGSYKGGPLTYYRVDFFKPKEEGDTQNVYLPILRNHRYIFNIIKVQNQGYATKDEAIAESAINAMEVETNYYDEAIGSISYDGKYLLGLSSHELKLKYQAYNGIEITAFTDCPGGWKAEVPKNPDSSPKYDWFRVVNNYDQGIDGINGIIKIDVDANTTGADRIGELTVSFGRMKETVYIFQSNEIETNIDTETIPATEVNPDSADIPTINGIYVRWSNRSGYYNNLQYASLFEIPWGVPTGEFVGYDFYRCYSVPYSIYEFQAELGTTGKAWGSNFFSAQVAPEDASWLGLSVTQYADNYIDFQVRASQVENYTDTIAGIRTGKIYLKYYNITKVIYIRQSIYYVPIPADFIYRDEYDNEYSLGYPLMVASTPNKQDSSWYHYANVPDNWVSFADPATNQVSPARKYSCARLNELNYLGFNSGWRLPTKEEANAIVYYVLKTRSQLARMLDYWNGCGSYWGLMTSETYRYPEDSNNSYAYVKRDMRGWGIGPSGKGYTNDQTRCVRTGN